MKHHTIVEILGDGISAELSESVHTVAEVLPCGLEFVEMDLSDPERERLGTAIYDRAEELMRRHHVALKYPTATTRESPNKVLRDRCRFAVIHRPVCSIPGIETHFTENLDIDVVRVATGGTYDDAGRRIGPDTAVSLRVISRGPSRHAARFAFKRAMVRGTNVVSTSKWTIQRETDGFFEEIVDQVAEDYPAVEYRRELFDALLAGLIMHPGRYGVIVTPNEYGDFLSDAACGLIGSVGIGDSASYAFDDDGRVELAMFDPAGGSAPDIAGQDVANPSAALLALANLLDHIDERDASVALRGGLMDSVAQGAKTRDIGGDLGTRAFTSEVIDRMRARLPKA
ncbi:MAG: isocitrate/isopropylmalate family dehydrogenase [Planctomycetota bacterium]|jgi:isocitrate dehydrogenase (NAD+)|nr:isocitrate/isopropylmalate family dehydrogenase [Planctomycetota bacterium]MDP6763658.1 isocitrate/isopropylmalate family dehydrogenase [Planctomycetota bacterium]MDP6987927.1 isocitrate/isopropylmalate family dehydrogenase [Planctomycetota bacterium]